MTSERVCLRWDGGECTVDMPRVPVVGESVELPRDAGGPPGWLRVESVRWLPAGDGYSAIVRLEAWPALAEMPSSR